MSETMYHFQHNIIVTKTLCGQENWKLLERDDREVLTKNQWGKILDDYDELLKFYMNNRVCGNCFSQKDFREKLDELS